MDRARRRLICSTKFLCLSDEYPRRTFFRKPHVLIGVVPGLLLEKGCPGALALGAQLLRECG